VYGYHSKNLSGPTGQSHSIDTDNAGIPYVVNKAGNAWKFETSNWTKAFTTPSIRDFGISPTNTFWKLDRIDSKPYSLSGSTWSVQGTISEKIAVGPHYTWTVDSSNNVKKYNGTSWATVTGKAREIGAGADGSIFTIGNTETAFKGFMVQKLGTSAFADIENTPSSPVKVNVDYMGHAWVTDIWGFIHNYTGKEWIVQVGNAQDAIRGVDDKVWVLNPYGQIKEMEGNVLEQVYMKTASQLTPATDSSTYVSNPIKRAGFFSSVKSTHPFTTTMVPKTSSSSYSWWRAYFNLKIGQSSSW
jgi:hypothetical protein